MTAKTPDPKGAERVARMRSNRALDGIKRRELSLTDDEWAQVAAFAATVTAGRRQATVEKGRASAE